jgi:RNA polymerase sigma-70 factor (family 1)
MEYAVYNEPDLIGDIADGDEQAFLQLFRHYSPLIRPFVRRITYSEVDADEIIQETFIRVWLNRDQLPGIQNLRNWIFTVAGHESMRYMRKKLTYEKNLDKSQKQQSQEPEPTPEQYTQLGEVSRIIRIAVEAMPPQRRLIYQLSREQGMKPAAIAQHLSLSVGTVKNVLCLSLKEIRERLLKAGIPLGVLVFQCFHLF